MTKPSLKLLFLRKYRTSKKYYRQLRLPSAINGAPLSFTGGFSSGSRETESRIQQNGNIGSNSTSGHRGPSSASRRQTNHKSSSAPVDTADCCFLLYDCLSHYRLKVFVFIVVVGIVSTSGLYFHNNQRLLQYRLSTNNNTSTPASSSTANNNYDIDLPDESQEPIHTDDTSSASALKNLHLKFRQQRHQQNDDEIVPYLNRVYREDVFSPKHGIRLKRCTIPALRPFSAEVKQFTGYTPKPNCVHEQSNSFNDEIPFSVRNGTVIVRNPKVDASHVKGCCYRPFHRNGENSYWSSNYCKELTEEITHIRDEIEYVELLCINSALQTDFRDALSLTPKKDQVEGRVETFEAEYETSSSFHSNNRLSVVILGLDATSRMNFLRAMPKSNKYLLKTMSAISLEGYTKVAENTLPNVIPLLTGQTLDEFKKKCVDESQGGSHVHLDECPFIWKVFAANGYRTGLAEDDVNIGIFNMNWGNAFVNKPTDYYLRPFSHLLQTKHSFKNGYCYGSSLSFEKLLDNIRSMAETFDGQTYFQFTWSTKLSHDDFNKLRWGDESLLKLLQHLHTGNYLNNTALLIIGDHGSRLDKIRSTAQGKLEDRMPVAYIALPKWFKLQYQQAYENLRKNGKRITSAFDVYKTLYDFLNLDNLLNKDSEYFDNDSLELPNQERVNLGRYRGLSLFDEVPENRTCFAAGIPLHWCVCHRKIPLDKESDIVQAAAEYVVSSLNTLMKDFKDCSELLLQSVDEVSKWDSSEIIRESCYTDDDNKRNVTKEMGKNATMKTEERIDKSTSCSDADSQVMVLQVAFTTTPGDATFETTVIQLSDGRWRLTEDVVRTNSYEGQSDCVEQKLKPYCYCVDDDSFFGGMF